VPTEKKGIIGGNKQEMCERRIFGRKWNDPSWPLRRGREGFSGGCDAEKEGGPSWKKNNNSKARTMAKP